MAAGSDLKDLRDLYVEQLRDLYNGEEQIIKALPKMAEKVSNEELRNAFEQHLEQTKEQKRRLEQIFEEYDEKPSGHTCEGMKGIIEEGREMMKKKGNEDARDAGLIAAAQRVEHYEIAGYGTARTLAQRLGENNAVELLQRTLEEEKETDKKLSRLAEQTVNPQAQRAS